MYGRRGQEMKRRDVRVAGECRNGAAENERRGDILVFRFRRQPCSFNAIFRKTVAAAEADFPSPRHSDKARGSPNGAVPVPQRALRANGAFDPEAPAFLKKIRYGVSNAPLKNTSKRHPIRTNVSEGGREPRRGLEGREVWGPSLGKGPLLLHQAFISSASKRSCRRSAAPYRARRRA